MFRSVVVFAVIGSAVAFTAPSAKRAGSALAAKSKSVPFLEAPEKLNENMAGYAGFDPIGFSAYWPERDWSQWVVPGAFPEAGFSTPVRTPEWMQEAEIKHGRIAMLAFLGWVFVDVLGARMPGSGYESIANSLVAHNAAVANGSMTGLLLLVSIFELMNGAAIYQQGKGSGRKPGEFSFDPLGLGKDPKAFQRYSVSEVKNGRAAMLAISGILTVAAAFPDKTFPYI